MDLIEPILGIASVIYTIYEEVKANKKRCKRLFERVKGLVTVLRATKQKGGYQTSAQVCQALVELRVTLESAVVVIKKYTADKKDLYQRMKNTFEYGDEFASVNDRLNDAIGVLSLNLQVNVDQNVTRLFNAALQQEEDAADRKEDCEEIQKMLEDIVDGIDGIDVKLEAMSLKNDANMANMKQDVIDGVVEAMSLKNDANMANMKQEVRQLSKMIQKSEKIPKDIRRIILSELIYDIPKKLVMKTEVSEIYKGQYRGFPVAVKRYLSLMPVIANDVKQIFDREIETMYGYESPCILKMFGVCFESGLIVMEYCEMGGLRRVLNNHRIELSWSQKARMCLDAAQGVYRLHQPGQRSKVHGSITSDKFMVADGYRVKLGCMELSQTETSLKRNARPKKGSLRYKSPEQLLTVHHQYCMSCEIYSLGMVLWEIATRKKPLNDCVTDEDIFERVCDKQRVPEPLPDDCPKKLGELINLCRAYEPFDRPAAGVLVDHLRIVAEELKEEWYQDEDEDEDQ